MNDSKVFSVDYYFSEKISKQINVKLSNVYLTESSAILDQLKSKKYDLVIIGTVHRYFNIFGKISSDFNTSIIVHNLNFTTISKPQLLVNVFKKDFAYRLKLLLKESLFSAPNVFKNAKNLLVLDESLIKENKNLVLKFLPVFHYEFKEKKESKILIIVIPGTVSQNRRDYLRLIKSIKSFNRTHYFQFIFLGKASGKELSWLKDFEKNQSIKYFTEKIPQHIFDEWMQKADFLWCPIQDETEFFSQKEFYGKTKMSGNIGDAIKYGKRAFFPKDFPNPQAFIIPEIDPIEKQFLAIKTQKNYNFQEDFNKEKVLENLENVLKILI
jgi:hypothetical protein